MLLLISITAHLPNYYLKALRVVLSGIGRVKRAYQPVSKLGMEEKVV